MLINIPALALSAHGGTQILVDFANCAASRGHSVRFIIPKGKIGKKYSLANNITICEVPICFKNKYLTYILFIMILPIYLRKGVVVANFFITYIPSALSSILFRTRLVYFVQGIESLYGGFWGGLLNIICTATYKSSRIVAANPYLERELARRGASLLGAISIGPTDVFYAPPISRFGDKTYEVICFPRREPWKGFDRLQRILALYQSTFGKLRVLAVSQDQDLLKSMEQRGYDAFRPTCQAELIGAFDRSKLVLFTSHYDGFGLPPLEGMARGLPAVVYECGGPGLYMQDGHNGFLIANDADERALSCIHDLSSNSAMWEKMSESALRTARGFSISRAMNELVDIVEGPNHSRNHGASPIPRVR